MLKIWAVKLQARSPRSELTRLEISDWCSNFAVRSSTVTHPHPEWWGSAEVLHALFQLSPPF
ncbi:hypothetical protein [Phormidium sp. CCY1219]|uniref:hypothetical protein n=1 Tax=Phormidium sp. CCY1219 TaxID=2886104 RepID=UPI002D1F567B|nr:hypothetical protein [Phormidium sp. CCY1219]MEB3826044.1 hypothetical protein [Phormidium sp. CCY1219]